MSISDILNLIAIIVIPIAAVIIGQHLQNRAEKRKDKMEIFKTLMISRNGWTEESVRALNIIIDAGDSSPAVHSGSAGCYQEQEVSTAPN